LFSVVVSSYSDVVEPSVVAEGDCPVLVDLVLTDPDVVGVEGRVGGSCLVPGVEGNSGSRPVFGSVGSDVVVVVDEPVDLGL
jgi:hypothetical protein